MIDAADASESERLADAETTLLAIREGRVDAIVVDAHGQQQVYTLESADLPYRSFLEQMAEGAVSLDSEGTILYSNRFFCDLVGVASERVVGTSFQTFIAPSSLAAYESALHSTELSRVGVDLRSRSGRVLPAQLAVTSLGQGSSRRFTVVITDLSERERLRELAAAQVAAAAASLAKDQFLAAVGHELRAPLSVVVGWTAYLLKQPEVAAPHIKKAVDAIHRNAELQRKLIEDLLDISRIVSGKLRLEREIVDLAELARSVEASMTLAAESKEIELHVQASSPVRLIGDSARLEQVLHNLLGNAIKFTNPGGRVRLTVDESGPNARVRVEDNGRGIERDVLPHVFEVFRQGIELRRAHSGLGLGLSITKRIVELHNGIIRAESEGPGRGATFTVELPAAPLALEQGRQPSSTPPSRGLLTQLRVLVVDDDKDMRELTSRVLEDLGAEVVSVQDAAQALARLDSERFDVIVSDIVMPGMNGFELARELRHHRKMQVPLVALTALPAVDHRESAEAAGFSAFLHKPLDAAALFRILRDLLARRSGDQALC